MTRVADGFQLPLERENVFEGLVPAKERKSSSRAASNER
jgi:hypothetical protein